MIDWSNTWMVQEVGRIHRQDLLLEAERDRLIQAAMAGRPGHLARAFVRLGGLLIDLGNRLERTYDPEVGRA